MRKIGVIIVGVMCCLLCGVGGGGVQLSKTVDIPQLSIDTSSENEIRCERTYNSDFNFTRLLTELAPVLPISCGIRSFQHVERQGIKCGVACGHDGGTVCVTSNYRYTHSFSAGVSPVDYYVYRQHRLII